MIQLKANWSCTKANIFWYVIHTIQDALLPQPVPPSSLADAVFKQGGLRSPFAAYWCQSCLAPSIKVSFISWTPLPIILYFQGCGKRQEPVYGLEQENRRGWGKVAREEQEVHQLLRGQQGTHGKLVEERADGGGRGENVEKGEKGRLSNLLLSTICK